MTRKMILECVVGSTLHGTHVDDGLEDLDLMGVFLEDPAARLGLLLPEGGKVRDLDIWKWRSKPEGVRSEAGDTDFVAYGLRRYLGMLLRSNPTVMLPLFAPPGSVRLMTEEGAQLRALAPLVVSKQIYAPFKGYVKQQFERMLGTRGQKNVTRPELVAKYGYDTKYAGHVMRLGLQGAELLRTGRLSLPMVRVERELIVHIRTGGYTFEQAKDLITMAEQELDSAYDASELRDKPDAQALQDWMIATYFDHWMVRP